MDRPGWLRLCFSNWCGSYAVTVYVREYDFWKPIKIGELIKINAKVIYTGSSSMHIMIDVFPKLLLQKSTEKKTLSLFYLL